MYKCVSALVKCETAKVLQGAKSYAARQRIMKYGMPAPKTGGYQQRDWGFWTQYLTLFRGISEERIPVTSAPAKSWSLWFNLNLNPFFNLILIVLHK